MEHEHEIETHPPVNKRIGILIGIMATILAFTEMAARNADSDVLRESVEASDTWAFFQAKSIRAAMLRADARALEAETSGQSQADVTKVAATIKEWNDAAAHEDSEPSTGEGRKELAAKAQAIEKHRDERNAAKETYEYSSGALELGILLASSAIVTGLIPLAYLGGVLGVVGSILGVLGSLAPHIVGG